MTTATPTSTLQEKFADLRTAMKSELMERDEVIEAMILAVISKSHLFLLGPPGVAKSLAVRKFVEHIGGLSPADYFEILMMRSTTREEVFGPLDLQALREGHYAFLTEGYLPSAKFAFLDEAWKANSAIMNSLLMASNERLFRNDGIVGDIPLWSLFMASNEMPEGDELAAIYDRVNMRVLVNPVQEPKNFVQVLKISMGVGPVIGEILTWDDIEQAHAESRDVILGDEIFDALQEVKQDLKNENIHPTERRFGKAMGIIQAAAWLDGEKAADIEHVRPLRHVLWDDVEQQPIVEKKMLELANPFDKEAILLLDQIRKISSELDKTLKDKDMDDDVKVRKGVELHNRVEDARNDLNKLSAEMKKTGSKRKSAKFQECKQSLLSVTRRLLQNVFDAPEEKLDDELMGADDDV